MLHRQLPTALAVLVAMTVLLGIAYPLAMTGIGQVAFEHQAGGSLIERGGSVVGSELIGRSFAPAGHFVPRPSAAGYAGDSSGASNLGPSSARLREQVRRRAGRYRERERLAPGAPVPVDAVTASGSGLDPHISVANARLQAPRVARQRGISLARVNNLIAENTEGRQLGFLGEEGVNVQLLNLALDSTG